MHSDLIRLLSPEASETYYSVKYILTFIDDYSRFTFVYFLDKKNKVFSTFKRCKVFIEKKLGLKIKIIYMD